MARLEGKVALVTGGGSGIGRAVSRAMAQEGARVVVAGGRAEPGQATVHLIEQAGGTATFLATDVAQAQEVEALVARAVALYGRVDMACNSAGTIMLAAFVEETEEAFDQIVATNFKGVWLCMKAEIQQMLKQGYGAVVNIASVNAVRPATNAAIYSATKAAVVSLTQAAALSYAQHGVRVNAINAGAFPTPMLERVGHAEGGQGLAELETAYRQAIPLGRLGRLEEIAEAAVWLCSEQASYVTGHVLAVDGGVTLA